jgi:hypothetical protein
VNLLETKEARDIVGALATRSESALRMLAKVDPLHTPTQTQALAAALLAPYRLAKMMRESLQRFGTTLELVARPSPANVLQFLAHQPEHPTLGRAAPMPFVCTMEYGRLALSQWLNLPNEAREEAERVLRGVP